MKKHLEVCGAILMKDGKILGAQRNAGKYEYVSYKWEFPGGKLEEGENAKEALHRELIEEMDVHVSEEDMEIIIEENKDLLMSDYETTKKDRAEEEMMDRICDLLNNYFEDNVVS